MSIQKRIKLIFDKIILEDIDAIKNYKYFEDEKLLVIYINLTSIDEDKYKMLDVPYKNDVLNMYKDIFNKFYKEYDEDGHLSTPEFRAIDIYEEYHGDYWWNSNEEEIINNISNYVTHYLEYVALEDLNISIYINCEK